MKAHAILPPLLLTLVLTLAACTSKTPSLKFDPELIPFSIKNIRPADGQLYKITPADSYLKIFVYRAGLLAALGHNHIVRSNNMQGYIFIDQRQEQSGFEFEFPVDQLLIDQQQDREQAGVDFTSVPTPSDIVGTRANMLSEKLLNAQRYPNIVIRSLSVESTDNPPTVSMRIFIKDKALDLTLPLHYQIKNGTLTARGSFDLLQSDLGLTPFSILAGAIAVQDKLYIQFKLRAEREPITPLR